jgi:hypothetical protein
VYGRGKGGLLQLQLSVMLQEMSGSELHIVVWGSLGILYWLWRRAHNLRFGVWADADLGLRSFRMAPLGSRKIQKQHLPY